MPTMDQQAIGLRKARESMAVKMLMKGAVLPGDSTVELKDFEVPTPGHGQVTSGCLQEEEPLYGS